MLKKCMYIIQYMNNTIEGLHHPSIKSLVSEEKKIWFPAVAHNSAVRISNQNNWANWKQNSKKYRKVNRGLNGVNC